MSGNMTKDTVVRSVAEKCGVSLAVAENFVNATFDTLSEGIAAGNEIRITGLLSVKRVKRAERVHHNPQDPTKTSTKPAHIASVMKMSKALAAAAETY